MTCLSYVLWSCYGHLICRLCNHGMNLSHCDAAKGHTAVLQAAVEAVKHGTKESFPEDSNDRSIKQARAWSKLMKDSLNQRGSRGETPVMVACEEGSVLPAIFFYTSLPPDCS